MTETPETFPWSHPVRIADLPARKPTRFELAPNAAALAAIGVELDIPSVKKLRFSGELRPLGRRDWVLEAHLGSTVVQDCVVTLDPVTTRIDETVTHTYLAEVPEYENGSETEMVEDESSEVLPAILDLGDVMLEALALYLPEYPRVEGAELEEAVFTEPGQEAMKDEDAKPFAGLKSLRDSLANKEE